MEEKTELKNLIEEIIENCDHETSFFYIKNIDFERKKYLYELTKELFIQLPDLNNKKFLEVGSASGVQSFLLKEIFPQIKLTAVEKNYQSFKLSSLINDYLKTDIKFINDNIVNLNVGEYDYIFESRMAGDVETFFKSFEEFYQTAKDDTKFLLLYPEVNNRFYEKLNRTLGIIDQYININETINLLDNYKLIDRKIILTSVLDIKNAIRRL